jgi:hypothetical protein
MADIRMMSAFGTVPGDAQEGILRVLRHALETVAQEDNSFTRAKAVFTESDENCVFTLELDAGKKEQTPLVLDLELLEDAVTDSGRQALLTEEVRQYVRRTLGQ